MTSTYFTKNGTEMVQLNLSLRKEIADDFIIICENQSKSVIFSQIVKRIKTEMIERGQWPEQSIPPKNYKSILFGKKHAI